MLRSVRRHRKLLLLLDNRARDYRRDSMLDVEETPDGPMLLVLQ